jgi:cell division protein ZapA (FtsZ GTPase activity inhibitor)
MAQPVKITLFGKEMTVHTEDAAQLQRVAELANARVDELRARGVRSAEQLAMAAALYLAEDLEKAQAEQVRMRAEWADRLERLAADAERHAQA